MEAPLKITPNIKEKIIINDLKVENILESNYTLNILFLSNSIIIKIIEEKSLLENEFSKEFTLEDLHKNGKFFKICENLSNLKSTLEETFQVKKPLLKVEKDFIKLTIIPIIYVLGESILLLPKIKSNDKENISILSDIIKKQQNEINNLNNKIINHEDRIKALEEIIKKLEKNENDAKDLLKSDIITSKEQIDLINEWINNKKNKYSLLYKGTRDGDSWEQFFEKCENKGPTILIIETTDGEILGGYTEKSWIKNKGISTPESFLFNINKKKKYFINGNGYIHSYGDFGFGDHLYYELHFFDNYLKNKSKMHGLTSYNLNSFEISGGKQNFNIKEMEVYKIN